MKSQAKYLVRIGMAICAIGMGGPLAKADGVDGSEFFGVVNNINFFQPGTYADGSALAKLVLFPSPSVAVSVNGNGHALIDAIYYFEVVGAQADLPAVVDISTSLQYAIQSDYLLDPNSTWGVDAQLNAIAYDQNSNDYDVQGVDTGCFKLSGGSPVCSNGEPFADHEEISPVIQFAVLTGEEDLIAMNVSTNIPEGGLFFASVDPVITFDPSFDSTGYSIIVSDGVGNEAATPEPGTAGLAALAIAGLVLTRVRSRNSALKGMN